MNTSTFTGKSWDVTTKCTANGMFISEFSISVYDGKDKETNKSKYFNLNCKCFGQIAENVGNQVQRQDELIVAGRMTVETWEKEGVKQYKNVLIIDEIGKTISKFPPKQDNKTDMTGFGSDVNDDIDF
jgi:single-stranded DNA-binding protein